jgi:hypothetical protein
VTRDGYETYTVYEPLSLCPADGWRAIYLDKTSPPGWSDQPLTAWGVFRVVDKPCTGSRAATRDHGNEICGVVHSGTDLGSYPQAANEASNFWHCRRIDDPDPTPEEVAEWAGGAR